MEYLTKEHYKIAKENGLKPSTVFNRVYKSMWTTERAITQSVNINGKRNVPNRKYYDIAEKNGISAKKVWQRHNYQGWSLEDACTIPIRKKAKDADI